MKFALTDRSDLATGNLSQTSLVHLGCGSAAKLSPVDSALYQCPSCGKQGFLLVNPLDNAKMGFPTSKKVGQPVIAAPSKPDYDSVVLSPQELVALETYKSCGCSGCKADAKDLKKEAFKQQKKSGVLTVAVQQQPEIVFTVDTGEFKTALKTLADVVKKTSVDPSKVLKQIQVKPAKKSEVPDLGGQPAQYLPDVIESPSPSVLTNGYSASESSTDVGTWIQVEGVFFGTHHGASDAAKMLDIIYTELSPQVQATIQGQYQYQHGCTVCIQGAKNFFNKSPEYFEAAKKKIITLSLLGVTFQSWLLKNKVLPDKQLTKGKVKQVTTSSFLEDLELPSTPMYKYNNGDPMAPLLLTKDSWFAKEIVSNYQPPLQMKAEKITDMLKKISAPVEDEINIEPIEDDKFFF